MLTHAIGFIQDVQLACFAAVFALMAFKDRANRSLLWLTFAYLAGPIGGLIQLMGPFLPLWVTITFATLAAPVGYACMHAAVVCFVSRGSRTRYLSFAFALGPIPAYLYWSLPISAALRARSFANVDGIITLADLSLALETALSAWLLLTTREQDTRWPRRVTASFFSLYALVEASRVVVYLYTGKLPAGTSPWVEEISGVVYVVACSVLPLGFIWMMNARLNASMLRQMSIDPLTTVLNRRGLEAAGEQELARYRRSRHDFTFVLIDLDHFKQFNDNYGHHGGDIVLRETAQLFRVLLRDCDVLGRLGGEEFVLLLPNTSLAESLVAVERLRTRLASHSFNLDSNIAPQVTASFGITTTDSREVIDWTSLLQEADRALYQAKHEGRDTARLYERLATTNNSAGLESRLNPR